MQDVPDGVSCIKSRCKGIARRMLSIGGAVNTRPASSKYPYVSQRLPRKLKGCTTNAAGQPVIMSRKHEDRVFKDQGYERE